MPKMQSTRAYVTTWIINATVNGIRLSRNAAKYFFGNLSRLRITPAKLKIIIAISGAISNGCHEPRQNSFSGVT